MSVFSGDLCSLNPLKLTLSCCALILDDRTSVCESTQNPIWAEEFLLDVSVGVSEIASVLIKVKDASQGNNVSYAIFNIRITYGMNAMNIMSFGCHFIARIYICRLLPLLHL